jgi:hypothetical protein
MEKMISLFKRNFENRGCPAYNEYEDGTEFILKGEAIATQKFNGSACLIKDGKFYKRYRAKKERSDFLHWSFDETQKTGHGWIPVKDTPDNQYHLEAWEDGLPDGTYELCGEKEQGNPEGIKGHKLIKHGSVVFENVPIDFDGLKEWLKDKDIEGIVFHGKNGEMIKIKQSDFGLKRVKK